MATVWRLYRHRSVISYQDPFYAGNTTFNGIFVE